MNCKTIILIAAFALAGPVTASAQANRVGLYAFHIAQVGECSLLDWHINVESSGEIVGVVGFDGRRARLQGTMQKNDTFQLTGREMASGRPVTVNGAVARSKLTMTIVGSDGPCDGKTVKLGRLTDGGTG
jgi:hypothetical protein